MERHYGKQLYERTTPFGDKLEIYFSSEKRESPFTFVVNDLSHFPCVSHNEAHEMFVHFYSPLNQEKTEHTVVERVMMYASGS